MNRYLVFPQDGSKPAHDLVCSAEMAELQKESVVLLPPAWANANNCYLKEGEIQECQPLLFELSDSQISADGQDEALITDVPAGVWVTWPDGQTEEVTDGEVRFSVDLPGTYHLLFTAVEYLDKEVIIEAIAAA